jgi:hypothetical protein
MEQACKRTQGEQAWWNARLRCEFIEHLGRYEIAVTAQTKKI